MPVVANKYQADPVWRRPVAPDPSAAALHVSRRPARCYDWQNVIYCPSGSGS